MRSILYLIIMIFFINFNLFSFIYFDIGPSRYKDLKDKEDKEDKEDLFITSEIYTNDYYYIDLNINKLTNEISKTRVEINDFNNSLEKNEKEYKEINSNLIDIDSKKNIYLEQIITKLKLKNFDFIVDNYYNINKINFEKLNKIISHLYIDYINNKFNIINNNYDSFGNKIILRANYNNYSLSINIYQSIPDSIKSASSSIIREELSRKFLNTKDYYERLGNELFGSSIKRDLKGFIWNDDIYTISSEVTYEEIKYGEGYGSFSISRGIFKYNFKIDLITNDILNNINNIINEIYNSSANYVLNQNYDEYLKKLGDCEKEIERINGKINNLELSLLKIINESEELQKIRNDNKLLKEYNNSINKKLHIIGFNKKKVAKHRNIGIGTFIPGFILLSGGGTGLGFTSYYIYQSNYNNYTMNNYTYNLVIIGCVWSCLVSITGLVLTIISIANFGISSYNYYLHSIKDIYSYFDIIYNNNIIEFSFVKRLFL